MEGRIPGIIPTLHYSSVADPVRDRFEIWRNAIASLDDLSPTDGGSRDALSVEASVWNLGGLVATHGYYSAQRRDRNTSVVRRSGLVNYRLILPLSGGSINLEVGDSRRIFRPGETFVTDLAVPDRAEVASGESIVLFLPREAVDALLPRPAKLHGLTPQGPLAGLLRDHVIGLVQALRTSATPAEAAPALAQATLQLFAAAVVGVPSPEDEMRAAIENALQRKIQAYIEAHLPDPDLSQEKLCRIFHMSRATLYRLFQPLGGVAAHVQARRLARIHTALLDPSRHHHLGRIAETHGFVSQAHMSRAYKARYGQSPSETHAALVAPSGLSAPGQKDYERWMRMTGV